MGKHISIKTEGNESIPAYLAMPEGDKGPGVLLMHAWWGLNSFFRQFADRLAKEGYVVLAPDLFDGRRAGTVPDAEKLIAKFDWKKAIEHEEAALDYLLTQPDVTGGKVAAIGFSMGGGYAAWLAARRPEVGAVVLFYGGGEGSQGYAAQTEAAFLGHFAEGDEWEPDEDVHNFEKELQEAGRDVTFHRYSGVGHWFMEGNRPDVYNPEAATLAWQRTLDFLRRALGDRTATDEHVRA